MNWEVIQQSTWLIMNRQTCCGIDVVGNEFDKLVVDSVTCFKSMVRKTDMCGFKYFGDACYISCVCACLHVPKHLNSTLFHN